MLFEKQFVNAYKSNMLVRHDPGGTARYFGPEDFPEIIVEEFDFTSRMGHTLKGYFYKKEGTREDRVILFEHGMGCGHRAYMREIATIVDAGYYVFSYDHTGTLASGGDHIGGLTQSLVDLDDAISALKAAGRLDGKTLSVIGHSWGGFSSMNIGAIHKDITHIVTMSGYPSVRRMLGKILKGLLKGYIPAVLRSEEERFGGYADADAKFNLLNTPAKVLLIHSRDDHMVPFAIFEELEGLLGERENLSFLPLDGKRHNPTYTADAVVYKDDFFAAVTEMRKKKKFPTPESKAEFVARYDFVRMTAQDEEVWQKIFGHLES